MSNIEETLRKIAAGTSKANSQTSSNTEPKKDASSSGQPTKPANKQAGLPGDPNCPLCGGIGYLRLDVPLDDPDFGKVQTCKCREGTVSRKIRDRLFALSNLEELQHLTFENFIPRGHVGLKTQQSDSLEVAHNQSRVFAQSLKGWLLLQGGYGCGKTHLAAAIANYVVGLGVPTLFITVPDLLDSLRYSYSSPEATFEQRFEDIRTAKLLVLDDFGTQNATAWAQEKLFQIINYRYINHLPLIITTNLEMEDIEGRIRSRLEDPELVTHVHIQAPDYRRPMEDTSQSSLSKLNLHRGQTFTSFEDRRGEGLKLEEIQTLENALKTAMEYARRPVGWLAFTGANFSGKTHLAAAIANYCQDELGKNPIFVSAIDLLDYLRATFSPSSTTRYDRTFNEVLNADLLVLDALGTQSSSPWGREKLFQLFDTRYNAKLPTVITMNMLFDDLYKTDPGIASRLLDKRLCTIVGITVPPFRGGAASTTQKSNRSKRTRN